MCDCYQEQSLIYSLPLEMGSGGSLTAPEQVG